MSWSVNTIFKSACLSDEQAETIAKDKDNKKALYANLKVCPSILVSPAQIVVQEIKNSEDPEKDFRKTYIKNQVSGSIYETSNIKVSNKIMAIARSAEKAGKGALTLRFELKDVPSNPEYKYISVEEIQY